MQESSLINILSNIPEIKLNKEGDIVTISSDKGTIVLGECKGDQPHELIYRSDVVDVVWGEGGWFDQLWPFAAVTGYTVTVEGCEKYNRMSLKPGQYNDRGSCPVYSVINVDLHANDWDDPLLSIAHDAHRHGYLFHFSGYRPETKRPIWKMSKRTFELTLTTGGVDEAEPIDDWTIPHALHSFCNDMFPGYSALHYAKLPVGQLLAALGSIRYDTAYYPVLSIERKSEIRFGWNHGESTTDLLMKAFANATEMVGGRPVTKFFSDDAAFGLTNLYTEGHWFTGELLGRPSDIVKSLKEYGTKHPHPGLNEVLLKQIQEALKPNPLLKVERGFGKHPVVLITGDKVPFLIYVETKK